MGIIWEAKGAAESAGKERGESLWIQKEYRFEQGENSRVSRPSLQADISTEVAVIGAGLAGILTAYLLQQRGVRTVLLESQEAGGGITKNTTAKISSQHSLIYHKLLTLKGEERAREYAMANQYAIEKYEEIINQLEISCDYEIKPSYIYTLDRVSRIRQEAEAAKRLGLPAVFTRETELPFQVKAAVRFERQAQFHPLKFLDAIASKLTIYEQTRIKQIQTGGLILTEQGSVRAKSIVIATHYPFINAPGYYFFKLHQERQYVAALEGGDIDKKARLGGMYLDADPDGYSFRRYKEYLLLGGGSHRAGKYKPLNAYDRLKRAAAEWYPDAKIKYIWSNQDCMTPDSVPYIGKYSVITPKIYVATGFNKWGMTNSMVSAMIISDMITGRENEYQKVFSPCRLLLSGSGKILTDTSVTTVSLLKEHMKLPHDKFKNIAVGAAGVINYNGERYGVYREAEDRYYFITTKCPHLGCSLEWNQNELTWDCPCHGSRFDYKGDLINNPATRDVFDAFQRKKKQ